MSGSGGVSSRSNEVRALALTRTTSRSEIPMYVGAATGQVPIT